MYISKKFQMYDYGSSEENKKHYGQVCFIKTGINRKARFLLHEVLKKMLLRAHKGRVDPKHNGCLRLVYKHLDV